MYSRMGNALLKDMVEHVKEIDSAPLPSPNERDYKEYAPQTASFGRATISQYRRLHYYLAFHLTTPFLGLELYSLMKFKLNYWYLCVYYIIRVIDVSISPLNVRKMYMNYLKRSVISG